MSDIPSRQLGPHIVSAIGLGCMNLSHGYGKAPPRKDAIRLLNRALDLGITLLDSAALYGMGENEHLLAEAVGHRRREFILSSKCVLDSVGGKRTLDGSPAAIARTLEQSLRRLGTDHIDLYYLHRLDQNIPIAESVGALVRAKEEGKIGAIGLSEMSADTLRKAHAVHPISVMESEYSPLVRNPEIAVLRACQELHAAFVAFSPLGRGMLAGAIVDDCYEEGDIRRAMPRFVGDNLIHNLRNVRPFVSLAAELDITPAQLSLAWVLARGDHVIPIPGTTNIAHMEENVGAAHLRLSFDTISAINSMFAGMIRGARYASSLQNQIDTEIFDGEELA